MTIQAVIFDFGGVLTLKPQGLDPLAQYDAVLGWPQGTLALRLFSGEQWELASTGAMSPEEHWAQVGKQLQERLPAGFRGFRGNPFHLQGVDRQMVMLAQRLRPRYRVALCSNALPGLAALLESRPDVRSLFEVIVISALVGLRKPDPGIFELTATLLDLPPAACLLVDDKERNVRAAEDVGMAALLFRSAAQLEADLRSSLLLED